MVINNNNNKKKPPFFFYHGFIILFIIPRLPQYQNNDLSHKNVNVFFCFVCYFLPPKLPMPGSIQSFFLLKFGSTMDVTIFTLGKAFVITVRPICAARKLTKMIRSFI